MRRDAGALRAEWFFDYLDKNLLTSGQQFFNFCRLVRLGIRLSVVTRGFRKISFVRVPCLKLIEILNSLYNVRDIQKGVAFETDVNKRALHTRQNF